MTDLVEYQATGVAYGPAGTGKTFAMQAALTGQRAPASRNRFQLIDTLTDLLAGRPRLVVVDEAQRLTPTASNSCATCTTTPPHASRCSTWAATAAGRCSHGPPSPHTAAALCAEQGGGLDQAVLANAYALLRGGTDA